MLLLLDKVYFRKLLIVNRPLNAFRKYRDY
jgi:hypothetical protein